MEIVTLLRLVWLAGVVGMVALAVAVALVVERVRLRRGRERRPVGWVRQPAPR
jgi:hypothetical protein